MSHIPGLRDTIVEAFHDQRPSHPCPFWPLTVPLGAEAPRKAKSMEWFREVFADRPPPAIYAPGAAVLAKKALLIAADIIAKEK
jgi:hypothetical protein